MLGQRLYAFTILSIAKLSFINVILTHTPLSNKEHLRPYSQTREVGCKPLSPINLSGAISKSSQWGKWFVHNCRQQDEHVKLGLNRPNLNARRRRGVINHPFKWTPLHGLMNFLLSVAFYPPKRSHFHVLQKVTIREAEFLFKCLFLFW